MTSPQSADVVVIGAGPGGYLTALQAARAGLETVLVSSPGDLGGVCVNRGCIPAKACLAAAARLEAARACREFGVVVDDTSLDFAALMGQARRASELAQKGLQFLLKQAKVTLLEGRGTLLGTHKVKLEAKGQPTLEIEAEQIVLACGTRPALPPIPGLDLSTGRMATSFGVFALEELPKRVAILGGGYQGLEFAAFFAAVGAEVTVFELLPQLLPREEPEAVKELLSQLTGPNLRLLTSAKVLSAEVAGATVKLAYEHAGATSELECDFCLVAAGRRPITSAFGPVELETDKSGCLVVDEHQRTNQPSIYAVGDLAGPPFLAHKAFQDAFRCAAALAGTTRPVGEVIPTCLYTTPEFGRVGLTEAEAKAEGYEVQTYTVPLRGLGRAITLQQKRGLVKLVAETVTGRVLGVTVVSPEASELMGEAALAVQARLTVEQIAATSHMHPTFAEGLREAAAALAGHSLHFQR